MADLVDLASYVWPDIAQGRPPSNPTGIDTRWGKAILVYNKAANQLYPPKPSIIGSIANGINTGGAAGFSNNPNQSTLKSVLDFGSITPTNFTLVIRFSRNSTGASGSGKVSVLAAQNFPGSTGWEVSAGNSYTGALSNRFVAGGGTGSTTTFWIDGVKQNPANYYSDNDLVNGVTYTAVVRIANAVVTSDGTQLFGYVGSGGPELTLDGYIDFAVIVPALVSDAEGAELSLNPGSVLNNQPLGTITPTAAPVVAGAGIDLGPYIWPDVAKGVQSLPTDLIEVGNSFSVGLSNVFAPNIGTRDLLSGEQWVSFGTPPTVNGAPSGLGFDNSAGYGGFYLLPAKNVAAGAQTHLLFTDYFTLSGGYAGLLAVSDASGANASLTFQDNNNLGFYLWTSNGTPPPNPTGIPSSAPFGPSAIVITGDSTGSTAYKDGVQLVNTGNAPASVGSTRITILGERLSSSLFSCKGRFYLYLGWDRRLSAVEIASISANPRQIFRSRSLLATVPGVSGVIYPSSDSTTTGWTATPGPSFYGMLNEVVADDTNYDTSPPTYSAPPLIMGLSGSLAAGSWTVNIRSFFLGNSGQVRALLLDAGSATVGTSSWQTLTSAATSYNLAVTTTGTAVSIRLEVQ